jgi:hypothetical protein
LHKEEAVVEPEGSSVAEERGLPTSGKRHELCPRRRLLQLREEVPTALLEESVEIEKELPTSAEVDASIEGEAAPAVSEELRTPADEEAARGSYSRRWYASLMVFFEDGVLTDPEAGPVSRQLVGNKPAW